LYLSMKPYLSLLNNHFSRLLCLPLLLGAIRSPAAETVFITATTSNCTSSANCGQGFNLDVNSQGAPVYLEEIAASFTSAISVASDKPATPGARFYSNTYSNSSPDSGLMISPTLFTAAGTYRLYHIYDSSAANVSTNILIGITNVSGCKISTTNSTAFQRSFGAKVGGQNQWQLLCYVTNDVGVSNPAIRFYRVTGKSTAGEANRVLFDVFKFVLNDPCLDIPPIAVTGPLAVTIPRVTVTGVSTQATKVTIYQDSGSGMTAIGSTNIATPGTNFAVSVTGLVKGAYVAATQTINGQEACTPGNNTGLIVGGGANPAVRMALSVRENTALTGPAGTTGPGTNNNIYYIGASAALSGGAPGSDAVLLTPGPTWQTVTFNRGADPANPAMPVCLWNNGSSGDGQLNGNYGVLDGLGIACMGDPGPFEIYIDDFSNGTNGVLQNFEAYNNGALSILFSQPSASGTTPGNLLSLPNDSKVTNATAYAGNKCMVYRFQYNATNDTKWVRCVTSGATGANMMIDLNQPITMKVLLLSPGDPLPPSPAPGSLTISRVNGQTVLSWSGAYPLQSSTNVNGPYTDVGVTSGPYTNTASSDAIFYRLRGN
jgi:hypothetical protein